MTSPDDRADDRATLRRRGYIAIEGPIGVGKSSLARRLAAELGADLLLEQADENPFLERYYADQAGYAFQTQLFFLFQRLKQVQPLAQRDMFSPVVVSDFIMDKDALFARLTLSDDEHRIYAQMYGQAMAQVPAPGLVIWLQAAPATLLQRIHQRGIGMELNISEAYLRRLCDAYADHFQTYDAAPVLTVDTEHFHPAAHDRDFSALMQALDSFQGRREMLCPPAARDRLDAA